MNVQIEIDDQLLPPGWRAIAYRTPRIGECYFGKRDVAVCHSEIDVGFRLVVERTDDHQPENKIDRVIEAFTQIIAK